MSVQVPDYIRSIDPYKPGKPIEEVEREYGISDSVKLASNENPLGPSPAVLKAIQESLARLNRYPDGSGHLLVRKIAGRHGVDPRCVVLGAGSDDVIGMLTRAFLTPDSEAVIPTPSFLMYAICVVSAGARPVPIPLRSLAMDLPAMADAVTPQTRMVFICNPNNPTGTIVHRQAFERFLERLPGGVMVVIDEAYIEFVRDMACASGAEYLAADNPVVVLRTFSKAFGLAGLRVGYALMPPAVAEYVHRIRQPFNTSIPAQAGALAALSDESHMLRSVRMVHDGLDFLFRGLDRLGVAYFPTQANFFLIDVAHDAEAVFEAMLREGVIVRSMRSYGYPTYIRVNAGLPEENARFLDALDTVLERLKRPHGRIGA